MKSVSVNTLTNPDDIEQFRQSFRSVLDPQPKAVCGETVSGDGSVYRGTAATQELKPGLRVFSLNLEAREDVYLEIEPNAPGFFFSLVLDGRSHWSQGAPDRASPNLSLSPGSNVFAGHHGDEQHWRIQAGHSHRIVELHLSIRTAVELFSEYLDPLPKDFRNVVMERADSFESVWRPLTPALRAAVSQILSCPMEGPLRRLFIESKALEILALELDLLASQVAHKQLKIIRSDRDKLAHAAQILEAELDNPPGLLELARRAGLNDFKLKRGFRVQFGESVFRYLRSLRMEKARAMLSESDVNVSEVAVAVGYSSFGHFTAAFRKQFGVLPKDLKKRPRL